MTSTAPEAPGGVRSTSAGAAHCSPPAATAEPNATAVGIVDLAAVENAVRSTAVEIAKAQLNKTGNTLGAVKTRMYGSAPASPRDMANPWG
ncbi:hypothetical protein ACWGQ5_32620 [Streptomyces sp. NPDC055722]